MDKSIGGVNTTADKTRQFCLVSTLFPISKLSVILNVFLTEQLEIGNWVKTRQNSSKLDSFVLSMSAVWTSYKAGNKTLCIVVIIILKIGVKLWIRDWTRELADDDNKDMMTMMMMISVIFVLIYLLVLVLVFQLFF